MTKRPRVGEDGRRIFVCDVCQVEFRWQEDGLVPSWFGLWTDQIMGQWEEIAVTCSAECRDGGPIGSYVSPIGGRS